MQFTDDETNEFKIEAHELLDMAEKSLLALDTGSTFASQYDAIFRAFHSLKGAAGMMEMMPLQSHMHKLENLLVEQKSSATLARDFVDHFLRGIDAGRHHLNGVPVEFDHEIRVKAVSPVPKQKIVAHAPRAEHLPKIMVIDDDLALIDLMKEILTPRGFEVFAFDSPLEALKNLDSIRPDVILTDVQMPVMSGLEVLKNVRASQADLPVVFVSGHADKDVLLKAIEMGVYAVLEKPFPILAVLEVCRNAVEKNRLLHLVNSSINLLVYQFADLEDYLMSQGKVDVRNAIDTEMKKLMELRRKLKKAA